MASVGFGSSVAAVAPASSAGRTSVGPRRTRLAATKGSQGAPKTKKKEKGILEFIVSAIVKDEQEFIETNPLLNGPAESTGGTAPKKAAGGTTSAGKKAAGGTTSVGKKTAGGTTSAGKKPAADSGGFNLGGLFTKKG